MPTKNFSEPSPIVPTEQEETAKETEEVFTDKVEEMLSSWGSEEQKKQEIEKIFLEAFSLKRMMWKRLYKHFGLEEKYV